MDIAIAGHQLDAGEAFQGYAAAELEQVKDKYFSRAVGANVTLSPGPHKAGFVAEIVMHVRTGVILKASGKGAMARPAFDVALAKIDKQLRRYVRRLRDHAPSATPAPPPLAAAYTVFQGADDAVVEADDASESGDAPLIVAEARVDVPDATVADAVMMLDLRNTTALLFKNTRTGAFNMVYRREDGNIGWVEPAVEAGRG